MILSTLNETIPSDFSQSAHDSVHPFPSPAGLNNVVLLHKINLATYNRAHPVPALLDMREYQNDRFLKQNGLLQAMSDVGFTQETTLFAFKDMVQTFDGISPDYQSFEALNYTPKSGKRAWTGLAVFFNAEKFELDGDENVRFHSYSDEYQKSWQEVGDAFREFLVTLLNGLLPPFEQSGSIRESFKDIIHSLSGPARTDGLLEVHLRHKKSLKTFVICTTHMESFDKAIRSGQWTLLLSKLQSLRTEYPDSYVVFGGDFNFELRNPIEHQGITYESTAGFLKQVLSAYGIQEGRLEPTQGAKIIDNIYVIPPSICDLSLPVDLEVLLAPRDYEEKGLLSDHKIVLRQLTFGSDIG